MIFSTIFLVIVAINSIYGQCPYVQPPNSVADPVCAMNPSENHYFTFFNNADLIGHNYCVSQKPTGQELVQVGKGLCTCNGQNSITRIYKPSATQCQQLITKNCGSAPKITFCARIHPSGPRFRTFKSICEAERHICLSANVNFIDRFNQEGVCNCFAAPFVPPSTTTVATPQPLSSVCAISNNNDFAITFNNVAELTQHNTNDEPFLNLVPGNGVCRCTADLTGFGYNISSTVIENGCDGINLTAECPITPKCGIVGPETNYNYRTFRGGECEALKYACVSKIPIRLFSNSVCDCTVGNPV